MEPLILLIEPELDERAATATMSRAQKVYEEGARDISRVMRQQLTQGTEAAGKGFEDLETKARRAYLGMQDAGEKVAAAERKAEQAREKGSANAETLARRVERARLDEIQAIERATTAYREMENAAQGAGQAGEGAGTGFLGGLRSATSGALGAGREAADGFAEGFAGSSALMRLGGATGPLAGALAVAAVGYKSGQVLMENIAAGMQSMQMKDLFQARLAVDDNTMRTYGEAASRAWTDGFGESTQGNLSSVQFGIQAGLLDRDATSEQVQQFASQVDVLKNLIGAGEQEIARGTRNFVKTGLVGSYEEGFDLIAAASARGLNISEDLLDTAEEYGTALQGVGLSGADAFGLIAQMQEAGIRNTDVAADSIKEMAISVSDGSELTSQAFGALGLNAEQLNRKFAEGGPAARSAFGEVLAALSALEDPVERNNVGLALFKTKWEDAKTAIQAADLSTAAGQMGDLNGAMDTATGTLGRHVDQWDLLGRNIDTTFTKLQEWLADSAIGKFLGQGLPGFFNDMLDPNFGNPTAGYQSPDATPAPLNPLDILGGGGSSAANGPGGLLLPGLNGPMPPGGPAVGPTDRVPVTPMPTAGAGSAASESLPDAPQLPLQYTSTAGLPAAIANAQERVDEARHSAAEKQARLNQLEQSNVADENDLVKARNDLAKANQDSLQAEQALTDARINATEQGNKQLGKLSTDLSEMGNQLDADFGLSKGLGGFLENVVKAFGNALTAPFLAALGMVEKANPNEGSGLIGIGAANGLFGSQYTPAAIAATQASATAGGGYSYAAGGAAPIMGSPGAAQPGQSARDFAHEVMLPFFQQQGLTVGDHAADKYGEHQNGALDIMVDSIAEGNAVLQQVLSDPNAYGAIFNNQAYGYGQGPGARPYSGGNTGNPTQDHQDHVHVWYKPGGENNIGGGGIPALSAPSPAYTGVSPGLPTSVGGGGGWFPGMGMPQSPVFSGGGAPLGTGVGSSLGMAQPGMPGVGSALGQAQGPGVGLGNAYPSTGGNSGNMLGGMAMDGLMAATAGLDMMMPGAGAAAKIGIQLANRTVGYAAQNAGILASGALETLSVGDNPKGSIGASWLGKGLGGLAGAAAALPNLAGKVPGPMTEAGGEQGKAGGDTINNQTVNVKNEKASEDQTGGVVAEHLSAMQAPAGRQ